MANIIISKAIRIICEGRADSAFFNALMRNRNIQNCEADCARTDNDQKRCAGKSGITDTLQGLKGFADTHPGKLRGVLLAIDTDVDEEDALHDTVEAIKKVTPKIACPTKFLEVRHGKTETDFSIAILGIPWLDRKGNLETLLFDSVQTTHADIIPPLNEFCLATQSRHQDWDAGLESKMKLRCTLACSYRPDPSLSLSFMLEGHDHPFDLGHPAFNPIAAFIADFVEKVTE
jgi:hypothetical protein